MNSFEIDGWAKVATSLEQAKGIAWDGCHKIYVLMDDETFASQKEIGYGTDDGTQCLSVNEPSDALDMVKAWWNYSCFLRFVNAVYRGGNTVDDYSQLIEQFEDDDWDDE